MRPCSTRVLLALLTLIPTPLGLRHVFAQGKEQQHTMLVTWFGPGAIELPMGGDWKLETVNVYDGGRRPVTQFHKGADLTASFILFENLSGNPTAKGCRDDVIAPIIQQDAKVVSKQTDGESKSAAGEAFVTTSFLVEIVPGHHQRNLFGFAGNEKTCAEIHVSTVAETSNMDGAMNALLLAFNPNLTYKPAAIDYFRIGSLLFSSAPALAVPYYKSSLAALPNDTSALTARRVATDQLVMSLGMSGDMEQSRMIAGTAIAGDPDYPINYYNLACIDAEQGDAKGAKEHLKQAFDRRANVLRGESMPDPTKDDSILKLKGDAEFWAFVKSLPKN